MGLMLLVDNALQNERQSRATANPKTNVSRLCFVGMNRILRFLGRKDFGEGASVLVLRQTTRP